jgi:hypothetical protein
MMLFSLLLSIVSFSSFLSLAAMISPNRGGSYQAQNGTYFLGKRADPDPISKYTTKVRTPSLASKDGESLTVVSGFSATSATARLLQHASSTLVA